MKKNDTESYISALAALLILFTAMVNPIISLSVAIAFVVALATFKYRTMEKGSKLRPFVLSGILACLLILSWSALHDILKGNEPSLYLEFAILGFCALILYLLLSKVKHAKLSTKANAHLNKKIKQRKKHR